MSTFKPTWLYIKQHNVTKLKYFGKTTKPSPLEYLGSGLHWRRHLTLHGADISTTWCKLFNNREELIEFAISFSEENRIVESEEWANIKPENGLDGGSQLGRTLSESCRKKLSDAGKKRVQSATTKEKISASKIGKERHPFSQSWKDNLSANHRSKHGYVLNHSEKTKKQIAEKLEKPVYCITNDTTYATRKEAAKILNVKVSNINACVGGFQKTTNGYAFRAVK